MDGLDAFSRVLSPYLTRKGKSPKHPSNPSIRPPFSTTSRPEGGPQAHPRAQAILDRRCFKTKTGARLAVFTWIEGWFRVI